MKTLRHMLWGPALIVASAAQAELHPIEGQAYRYDSSETRGDGTSALRFATHRTVVFRHDAAGLIAEVRLDSIERPDNMSVGAMFAAGQAGLLHRPIRFHVDATGNVTAIDDMDLLWSALIGGIERMGDVGSSASGDPRGAAQAMIAPLRGLPGERRLAMLGSIVSPLLNADAAARAIGERPVTLPARPPAASGTTLSGIETVSRTIAGTTTIRVTASGPITLASSTLPGPGEAGGSGARMSVTSVKNVAPNGLLTDKRELRETILPSPHGDRRSVIETVTTLQPAR